MEQKSTILFYINSPYYLFLKSKKQILAETKRVNTTKVKIRFGIYLAKAVCVKWDNNVFNRHVSRDTAIRIT